MKKYTTSNLVGLLQVRPFSRQHNLLLWRYHVAHSHLLQIASWSKWRRVYPLNVIEFDWQMVLKRSNIFTLEELENGYCGKDWRSERQKPFWKPFHPRSADIFRKSKAWMRYRQKFVFTRFIGKLSRKPCVTLSESEKICIVRWMLHKKLWTERPQKRRKVIVEYSIQIHHVIW